MRSGDPVRESSQHVCAVRDGLGVRQDRKPARIVRSDPDPIERGDDRRPGRVRRATPKAARRRPPQQIDGHIAPAGVERLVRSLDQQSKTPGVQEITERNDLADGNEASPLDRAQVGSAGQAHEVRDDAPLAELTGQLGRAEEQRATSRRVRRELRRAPQHADGHRGCPALKHALRGQLDVA